MHEPTADAIRAEPPGRRLDLWVGIALFGWRWYRWPAAPDGSAGLAVPYPPEDGRWERWAFPESAAELPGEWWPDGRARDWDRLTHFRDRGYTGLPNYSTKPGDAWAVVERLAEQRHVRVRVGLDGRHGVAVEVTDADPEGNNDPARLVRRNARVLGALDPGVGGDMPLAVCRAALLACRDR